MGTVHRRIPFVSWLVCLIVILGSSRLLGSSNAKEVEVTREWTKLGENDTIPAGMHVRMDMTTGEKWVKQIDQDEDKESKDQYMAAAVVQGDGSVSLQEEPATTSHPDGYDFEMMHRTLSKLPEEEKDRMGGIPELPQAAEGSIKLTSKERELFEKRMAEIWERRQEELRGLEEFLLDVPEMLKARVASIKEYLGDPISHLNQISLDDDSSDPDVVKDIVSVLKDLEYQLSDVDNARDFHTLGGWPLLVSLISEDVHVPENKTIARLSRNTEAKIRVVQANAAWAAGTAVKNTGEFYPYAVEPIFLDGSTTTALDVLIDVFCEEYDDPRSWEIRSLLARAIYGIGALTRGNPIAQAHLVTTTGTTNAPTRLGNRLRELVVGNFPAAYAKLIQRLLGLASDVITDIELHRDEHGPVMTMETQATIIEAFSSADWCDSAIHVLVQDNYVPVQLQETLLTTLRVLAPHCKSWKEDEEKHLEALDRMVTAWQNDKETFDDEHFKQLVGMAEQAREALAS